MSTILAASFWHYGLSRRLPTSTKTLRTLRDAAVYLHTHYGKRKSDPAVAEAIAALTAAAQSGSDVDREGATEWVQPR